MNNNLEIKRKLFHIIAGLLAIVLLDLKILNVLILSIILLLGIISSILIKKKIKIPLIYWFLNKMDRDEDLKNFPGKGPIFFVLGCILSLLLFEKNLALASIMVLTIGDAVSLLFGINFGRTVNPLNKKKLIEGTIIGILLSTIAATLFLNLREAFIASLFGMIIESIELRITKKIIIDDNITVPLIAGSSVLLFRLLGI